MTKSLKAQQNIFTKHKEISETSVKVSYVISEMIAKHSKPFTEGFVKECLIMSVELLCSEKKHLFNRTSLSASTITRRIEELSENLKEQLTIISQSFVFYSLCIEEYVLNVC